MSVNRSMRVTSVLSPMALHRDSILARVTVDPDSATCVCAARPWVCEFGRTGRDVFPLQRFGLRLSRRHLRPPHRGCRIAAPVPRHRRPVEFRVGLDPMVIRTRWPQGVVFVVDRDWFTDMSWLRLDCIWLRLSGCHRLNDCGRACHRPGRWADWGRWQAASDQPHHQAGTDQTSDESHGTHPKNENTSSGRSRST